METDIEPSLWNLCAQNDKKIRPMNATLQKESMVFKVNFYSSHNDII